MLHVSLGVVALGPRPTRAGLSRGRALTRRATWVVGVLVVDEVHWRGLYERPRSRRAKEEMCTYQKHLSQRGHR